VAEVIDRLRGEEVRLLTLTGSGQKYATWRIDILCPMLDT
jgi:hypothetical protein